MTSVIDQIHSKLNELLGGTNPNQMFCMMMPGTSLDQATYAWDTKGAKPATVKLAESELVNQMFDPVKVTASSNGRHLAYQYLQALSVLVPRFDAALADVKGDLRDFLNSQPDYRLADGSRYPGSVRELYFKLLGEWIDKKQAWEKMQDDMRKILEKETPQVAEDKYLVWYETTAEGRLTELDALMGKLLSFFAPADMDAMLGALAAGPGGAIEEARNTVLDIREPSPHGGFVYPVELRPADWFLDLASDAHPDDLLDAPEYLALKLSARQEALEASIAQVTALIQRKVSDKQLVELASAASDAQREYSSAQTSLVSKYSDNTAIAVKIYLRSKQQDSDPTKKAEAINKSADALDKAKGGSGKNKSPITPNDVDDLVKGQNELVAAQQTLTQNALKVASSGLAVVNAGADDFGELQPMLTRLQALLADVQSMESQLDRSLNNPRQLPPPPLSVSDADKESLEKVALEAEKVANAGGNPEAVYQATVEPAGKLARELAALLPVAADLKDMDSTQTAQAIRAKVNELRLTPKVEKSPGSDRFMSLTMYMTSDEMDQQSKLSSSYSQTDWNCSLFFGSAGGSSSESKLSSAKDYCESSTAIEIGMKVAKVEIERGWFEPGLFNLSGEMNRLSADKISVGAISPDDRKAFDEAKDSLLPCFPVAFVVAKDVQIRFKASASQLHAVKQVADSKSAIGGGFLCFSASHSEASHDESQSVSSRADGQVVTINIRSPQILGWFLEFTPADKSVLITEGKDEASTAEFRSVSDYLSILRKPRTVEGAPSR